MTTCRHGISKNFWSTILAAFLLLFLINFVYITLYFLHRFYKRNMQCHTIFHLKTSVVLLNSSFFSCSVFSLLLVFFYSISHFLPLITFFLAVHSIWLVDSLWDGFSIHLPAGSTHRKWTPIRQPVLPLHSYEQNYSGCKAKSVC